MLKMKHAIFILCILNFRDCMEIDFKNEGTVRNVHRVVLQAFAYASYFFARQGASITIYAVEC